MAQGKPRPSDRGRSILILYVDSDARLLSFKRRFLKCACCSSARWCRLGRWCVIADQQGFAVLPSNGVVALPTLGVEGLGDGLAEAL
jgi:hypothetical protein